MGVLLAGATSIYGYVFFPTARTTVLMPPIFFLCYHCQPHSPILPLTGPVVSIQNLQRIFFFTLFSFLSLTCNQSRDSASNCRVIGSRKICSRSFVTNRSSKEGCCWCLNRVGWSIIYVSRYSVRDLFVTQRGYFQGEILYLQLT